MSHDLKQTINCKTCTSAVDSKTVSYHCIACGEHIHLTPKCIGVSHDVIFGLSTLIHNVLLFCQSCIELKKKDQIIDQISSSREKPEQKKFEENVKTLRIEVEKIKNNLNVKNLFVQQQLQELIENLDNKKFPRLNQKKRSYPKNQSKLTKKFLTE